MFLNNPASTRSILSTNNENANLHRTKSLLGGENNGLGGGKKKASFDENSVTKTPHRNKEGGGGGGQTTQRRRRALGDISNRKGTSGAGGGGGGKSGGGGVVLKQQTSSKIGNNSKQVLFPSSSSKSRNTSVKFSSKTPSTKPKARLGGLGSGVKSAAKSKSQSKQQQRASNAEYDGVFGVTTRWSTLDVDQDDDQGRLPIPEDEFNMFDNLRDEMHERHRKKEAERDRLENERDEERIMQAIRDADEADKRDVEEFIAACDVSVEGGGGGDQDAEWDLMKERLPWEEEEDVIDPAYERRLSGADPYSLWGDINDF